MSGRKQGVHQHVLNLSLGNLQPGSRGFQDNIEPHCSWIDPVHHTLTDAKCVQIDSKTVGAKQVRGLA